MMTEIDLEEWKDEERREQGKALREYAEEYHREREERRARPPDYTFEADGELIDWREMHGRYLDAKETIASLRARVSMHEGRMAALQEHRQYWQGEAEMFRQRNEELAAEVDVLKAHLLHKQQEADLWREFALLATRIILPEGQSGDDAAE